MDPLHADQPGLLQELSGAAHPSRPDGTPPNTGGSRQRTDGSAAAGSIAAALPPERAGERHSRQVRFAPFGAEGQAELAKAHALVVGVGALGSHVAQTLARAGIGRLTLVDRDVVDLSNLQRQVLFETEDASAGLPKASAAARALARIDPAVEVVAVDAEFDRPLWQGLDRRPDLLVDGTDNFATRFLLNAIAIESGVPWIHGAVVGAEGRAMVVRPGLDPCLACILPDAPSDGGGCDALGVLAPAVAHVAAFQATEAIKLLGRRDAAITRGLFVIDVWQGRFDLLFRDATPRADCPVCGIGAIRATASAVPPPSFGTDRTATLCGRNAIQVRPQQTGSVDLAAVAVAARAAGHRVDDLAGRALRVQVGELRVTLFPDGRALVFGTEQADRALAAHDALLGAGPGVAPPD